MLQQLEKVKERFEQITALMAAPDVAADIKQYAKLNKEYKDLAKIVDVYNRYTTNIAHTQSAQTMLQHESDAELKEMAREELATLAEQQTSLEKQLKTLLIPKDPNDSKNSILELRAGTGGNEASIWAGDLFRMYQRFAERRGWKLQVVDYTEGVAGGYKEIVCTASGDQVYAQLKYESGVHRVQRVPATETQGRIHTSAASVVVLPEVDEVSVAIDMNEVRKDTFCSSGPGGQSVNTTYSAIRLTHLPTGIVVSCQDEKSQLKNFDKALKVLRARLHEKALQDQQAKVGAARKSMVGSGDRSEKIRTYNYAQGRVTDHRINYTQYNLLMVLDGALDNFIEALRLADNTAKLQTSQLKEG